MIALKHVYSLRLFLAVVLFSSRAFSEDIRVACPYVGFLTNKTIDAKNHLNLKDGALMEGVFFQWINPEKYQWNVFIYGSKDINYSDIWGGNAIADYYMKINDHSKWVLGAGTEYMLISMGAGPKLGLDNLEMSNNVLAPYLRFGWQRKISTGKNSVSVFPWAGIEYEKVFGTITVDPPGPFPPPIKSDIKDAHTYAMTGLTLKLSAMHIFDVDAKYYAAYNAHNLYNVASGNVNAFLTRHLALSYRLKYMETSEGWDLYNMAGIAFVF